MICVGDCSNSRFSNFIAHIISVHASVPVSVFVAPLATANSTLGTKPVASTRPRVMVQSPAQVTDKPHAPNTKLNCRRTLLTPLPVSSFRRHGYTTIVSRDDGNLPNTTKRQSRRHSAGISKWRRIRFAHIVFWDTVRIYETSLQYLIPTLFI